MELTMFERLLQLPLFQGLSTREVTDIMEHVRLDFVKYHPGEDCVYQGDACRKLIYVISGSMASEYRDEKGRFTLREELPDIKVIEPYNMFGMYRQFSRTYTFTTEGITLAIDKVVLMQQLLVNDIVKHNLLNIISNRYQQTQRQWCNTPDSTPEEKIAKFILAHSILSKGRKDVHIKMTVLADIVHETRLNVSRALNSLKQQGIVILHRNSFEVKDLQDLYKERMNPFYVPHRYPPFDQIRPTDYEPAMMRGMEDEDKEIDRIVSNPEPPTFANTIEALEHTGDLLSRVTDIFFNILSAETTDFLDNLAQKLSPLLSEHSNNITLNEELFQRVKAVYEDHVSDDFARLDSEQKMLLTKCYEGFVRNGANLPSDKKEQLRKVTSELSVLSLQFSQNKLKDTNDFILHLTDQDDLAGLPRTAIDQARHDAKEKGMDGYVFTLQAPSYSPFLTYSSRRDLRQKMYMAYNTLCTHPNENNNTDIVRRMVNLRREMAQLLGFDTYADYALSRRMAEKTENVYQLLNQLIEAYMPTAQEEVEAVRRCCEDDLRQQSDLADITMQPWDFAYYANKLKEQRFNINSEKLRPYFELSKVKKGVFGLATRLYGITFHPNPDVPVYHPNVEVYDVKDSDGTFLALLYCDFHPRSSKKSGAWMTAFKEQWKSIPPTVIGKRDADSQSSAVINSRPQVSIVMNLTKPTASKPALLTLGEVETFLHEFGHALHGIFADTTYRSLSGTNVYWDFVELPSQFMENFAIEPEFLNTFATHYKTGDPLPQELIDSIIASRNFNVAYACMRQVSFGLLDMAYYTLTQPLEGDIVDFERQAWHRARVLPEVPGTCMSTQFSHIMAGGYSAGYYSYKWAEVLDADAFSLFKEQGIFNRNVAQNFRDNILSRGGTEHPMTLYKRFRGQEPTIDALLRRNGIIKQ